MTSSFSSSGSSSSAGSAGTAGAASGDAPRPAVPVFDPPFRRKLETLFQWRRDVRRFLSTPVDPEIVREILRLTCLSPSVGNSQPWRFVMVSDPARRARIRHNYSSANSEALHRYHGERASQYATLKLAGLDKAPVQIAVFCETNPLEGAGLGRNTMPQTLQYSVSGAVAMLSLIARAWGVGVGLVSILDPQDVKETMDVPQTWEFVSYLCLGYPEEEHSDPELVRYGWQDRLPLDSFLFQR